MGIIPRRRRAFSAVKFSPGPARNFAANDEDSYRRIDGSLMANRLADADLRVPPRKGANYSPGCPLQPVGPMRRSRLTEARQQAFGLSSDAPPERYADVTV